MGADGELVWQVLSPPSRAPLLAISFAMHDKKAPMANGSDAESWRNVLAKLDRSSRSPAGNSRIFIDTFFRHVGDQEILAYRAAAPGVGPDPLLRS